MICNIFNILATVNKYYCNHTYRVEKRGMNMIL